MDALMGALSGLVGGAIYGLSSYFKATKLEEFEFKKFAPAVTIGLVAGIYAGMTGMPIDEAGLIIGSGFAAMIVENVWKAIFRRFS